MSVTVTKRGEHKVDVERMVAILKTEAVSRILRRTAQGVDATDKPFVGYSSGYLRALMEGGEATSVDLRLTGGLLNSVRVVRVERVSAHVTRIVIAPDSGTSPAVSLADGRAQRTARRGPPHNALGRWLHYGTPRMPPRPWLRLSPKDRLGIRTMLRRALAGG